MSHSHSPEELRRIGYPLSRELTLKRIAHAAVPPAAAGDLAGLAREVCWEAERAVNGSDERPARPFRAVELMIVANELLVMALVAEKGIGRG